MRGRRPKPTKFKLIAGNPGRRPLNKGEPRPKTATTRAPAGLSRLARKHWTLVAKQLADARILTELDKPALMLYCEAWARWREATTEVEKGGMLIKAQNGFDMQNPYLAIANKAADQMHKMMSEFGMTPSSRSRVQVDPESDRDPMDDFLKKRT